MEKAPRWRKQGQLGVSHALSPVHFWHFLVGLVQMENSPARFWTWGKAANKSSMPLESGYKIYVSSKRCIANYPSGPRVSGRSLEGASTRKGGVEPTHAMERQTKKQSRGTTHPKTKHGEDTRSKAKQGRPQKENDKEHQPRNKMKTRSRQTERKSERQRERQREKGRERNRGWVPHQFRWGSSSESPRARPTAR